MRAPAPRIATALTALALLSTPTRSGAVTGTLDGSYGGPLAIQSSQSNVGGANEAFSQMNQAFGSQLVAAYGTISGGALHLFFTGNLTFWWQLEGNITHWQPLDVFIDSGTGGQHQLLMNNPAINQYYDLSRSAGLTFDQGFAADYWLSLGSSFQGSGWPYLQAYYATLPSAGSGSGVFLGETVPGPPGTLANGINPYDIAATLDDSNHSGIGNGCGAASAVATSTGVEWAIPLAAIGNPTGCIRVCAYVAGLDHSTVSNQVLGGLPPGTCSLTSCASTDFSAIPGDQFFTVCPSLPTPSHTASWGTLKAIYH
jgi:hypothetical protein